MLIQSGKLNDLSKSTGGWFIGNFMPTESPFNSNDFEVKWIERKAGEVKENPTPIHKSTALKDSVVIVFRWLSKLS